MPSRSNDHSSGRPSSNLWIYPHRVTPVETVLWDGPGHDSGLAARRLGYVVDVSIHRTDDAYPSGWEWPEHESNDRESNEHGPEREP